MSIASVPRGAFYSWLESFPMMEPEALKWTVEIFWTKKSHAKIGSH